jgi:hypothetical protein
MTKLRWCRGEEYKGVQDRRKWEKWCRESMGV